MTDEDTIRRYKERFKELWPCNIELTVTTRKYKGNDTIYVKTVGGYRREMHNLIEAYLGPAELRTQDYSTMTFTFRVTK